MRGLAHVLHASGEHGPGLAQQNPLSALHDGLETGTAEAIDGQRGNFFGNSDFQADVAGPVYGVSGRLKRVAKNDMIDFGRIGPRAFERFASSDDPQVNRRDLGEVAVVLGHRSAGAFENDDFFHPSTPTRKSTSNFRSAPAAADAVHGRRPMTDKFGKYEVVRQLASGGFGSVFEARDPVIERAVAIKTCHVQDEEVRARFLQEARLAGNLHHRNLTTIYDIGAEGDVLYLVCEFLPGEDLDAFIGRRDQPLIEKVEILIGVAYGLAHAHDQGVIHRDIKPSNIRILPDRTVKIMDFGIAKSMYAERTLTRTGLTLGTTAYLAPEQVRGEPVDRRTDIFSFGVLAYELL